jgi:ribosomal protein L16 Arg81 hydroxylase
MNTPKKGPSSPQGRLSQEEFIQLSLSDLPEDQQKIEAVMVAEIEAMSPEERAELEAVSERFQARVLRLLDEELRLLKK